MFLQRLPLLSSCRDSKTKTSGTAELEMWNAKENANSIFLEQRLLRRNCTFYRKYPYDYNIGKQPNSWSNSVGKSWGCFSGCDVLESLCLAGSIKYIGVIWCLWILGKQRLRGEQWLLAVVSQTPALNPTKNDWFYSDNMFMLQSALVSQTF